MIHFKRSQMSGVVGALLLCAAWAAHAQAPVGNSSAGATGPAGNSSSGAVIGPPQLKDFQLEPRERIVTQPPPQTQTPAETPPRSATEPQRPATPPVDRRPSAAPPPVQREAPAADPATTPATGLPPIVAGPEPGPLPEAVLPSPPAAPPAPDTPAVDRQEGGSLWPYGLVLLALLGAAAFWVSRRTRSNAPNREKARAAAAPAPEPVRAPAPRPWLELELKAERASFTDTEWVVQFQLAVSNTGKSPARNVRIDIMLFNAGKEQDKEIGAFFRTAGRESTKLHLPAIRPGGNGIIDGEVAMPLSEMRAMKLNDRTLFIPVIAVNGLYEWGEERTGQTAKSYVIGRELQEPSEKMGAFRVDQGPRIWRTVGQRPHRLARRY